MSVFKVRMRIRGYKNFEVGASRKFPGYGFFHAINFTFLNVPRIKLINDTYPLTYYIL